MNFGAIDVHISLAAEKLFEVGGVSITNAMLLGIIGFIVTSKISFNISYLEDKSGSSMSGFPLEVASVRLLIQIASNSFSKSFSFILVFSTINPVMPLWASNTLTMGFELRSLLNIFSLISGVVPTDLNALLI